MKKRILFLSIAIAVFTSCIKHEYTIDTSLKVGNLYCSDGSVISPAAYSTSGKTAVGVIFWVNNNSNLTTDRALAVSLENLPPVAWAEMLEHINNVSTDLKAFNGASNTASIIIWGNGKGVNTPASIQAYNYAKHGVPSWFLPSVAEALQIYTNKDIIYNALNYCGGEEFNEVWYWTSTQDGTGAETTILNALSISLTEGRATGSGKINTFAVRPIIAIK